MLCSSGVWLIKRKSGKIAKRLLRMTSSSFSQRRYFMFVAFLCVINFFTVKGSKVCISEGIVVNHTVNGSSVPFYQEVNTYSCPRPNDSPELVECCHTRNSSCCSLTASHLDPSQRVMLVSIAVILICVIAAVVVSICCFWSKCPLFPTCRVRYLKNDIVAYSKDDTMKLNGMPEEVTSGQRKYEPHTVKVMPIADV